MGRPRGSKNRKTILREQALAAAPMTPIEFLQSVMQSPDVDPKLRVEAAKIPRSLCRSCSSVRRANGVGPANVDPKGAIRTKFQVTSITSSPVRHYC